jgi:hypothetical protein
VLTQHTPEEVVAALMVELPVPVDRVAAGLGLVVVRYQALRVQQILAVVAVVAVVTDLVTDHQDQAAPALSFFVTP